MTISYLEKDIFLRQNQSFSLMAFLKIFIPGLLLSTLPLMLGLETEDTWNRILSIVGPIIIIISFALLAEMIFPSRRNFRFRKQGIFISYKGKNRSYREELEVDAIAIKGFEIVPSLIKPELSYLKIHIKAISSAQPSEYMIRLFLYVKKDEEKGFIEKLGNFFDEYYYHNIS